MSWGAWGARLNVTSIVSQGLEQVNRLKEDVEKQFDQVVTGPPVSSTASSATGSDGIATSTVGLSPPHVTSLFGDDLGSSSTARADSTILSTPLNPLPPTIMKDPVDFFDSFLPVKTESPPEATSTIALREEPDCIAPTSIGTVPDESVLDSSYGESEPVIDSNHGESEPVLDSNHGESEPGIIKDAELGPDVEPELSIVDVSFQPSSDLAIKPTEVSEETPLNGSPVPQETGANQDDDLNYMSEYSNDMLNEESIEISSNESDTVVVERYQVGEGIADVDEISEPLVNVRECKEKIADHIDVADLTIKNVHDQEMESPVPVEGKPSVDDVVGLKTQLQQRETQLMTTSAAIQELHDELDKACAREVSVVERNRFLTEQLELMRQEMVKLHSRIAQQQQATRHDAEVVALQQAVAEKDQRMAALLDEGQALSVKQAQMEQRLRQLRREKNEEEEKKLKLAAQYDVAANQIQELTIALRAVEDDNKNLRSESKHALSTADQKTLQLSKAENEILSVKQRIAELESQVLVLEGENQALRTEVEELAIQHQSHASLSAERGDMDATIQFLQQQVRDLELEIARREDTARIESTDLKRKWQDALQRVDAMGQSVTEATGPLLVQIRSLQDEQRSRIETWQATELTFRQRIDAATEKRRELEHINLQQEQELHSIRMTLGDLQHEVERKEAEIVRERERGDHMQRREKEANTQIDSLQHEISELKNKLQREQEHQLQQQTALLLTRTVSSEQVSTEASIMTAELEAMRQREVKLQHDLQWHQKELQRVKLLAGTVSSPRTLTPPLLHRRSFDDEGQNTFGSSIGDSQASILQRTLDTSTDDSRLGVTSVLGLSQLQQRLRLREGENRLLRQQLQGIEDRQKQTTDEIVRLSTRNALLEASAAQFEAAQSELDALKARQHVLLELFGEKEEQVEELQSEVSELKAFYRKQLDTLTQAQ